jgi:hypothetical protein
MIAHLIPVMVAFSAGIECGRRHLPTPRTIAIAVLAGNSAAVILIGMTKVFGP